MPRPLYIVYIVLYVGNKKVRLFYINAIVHLWDISFVKLIIIYFSINS
jgi:hypothetical protein